MAYTLAWHSWEGTPAWNSEVWEQLAHICTIPSRRINYFLCFRTCSDIELATEPFVLPGCDEGGGVKSDIAGGNSILAWFWGRFPAAAPVDDFPLSQPMAFSFPLGMKAGSLYPEVSSQYVSQDGTEYDVPCSIPGASEVEANVCPAGFVPPRSKDRTEPCFIHSCTLHTMISRCMSG